MGQKEPNDNINPVTKYKGPSSDYNSYYSIKWKALAKDF